jgi:hypothetical protein
MIGPARFRSYSAGIPGAPDGERRSYHYRRVFTDAASATVFSTLKLLRCGEPPKRTSAHASVSITLITDIVLHPPSVRRSTHTAPKDIGVNPYNDWEDGSAQDATPKSSGLTAQSAVRCQTDYAPYAVRGGCAILAGWLLDPRSSINTLPRRRLRGHSPHGYLS